jgi:small-conductance mechanosensitive channel
MTLSFPKSFRACSIAASLIFSFHLAPGRASGSAQAPAPGIATKTQDQAVADGSTRALNGSEPGQPTAPKPATAITLARLPQPLPASLTQGVDVDARSAEVLAHLSEVLRFYRLMAIPVQKIGEPSDVLYSEQARTAATEVAQLAFQAARDEAGLLARVPGAPPAKAPVTDSQGESQKLESAQISAAHRIASLAQQQAAIDAQMAKARGAQRAALEQQLENVQGEIELNNAMAEALGKVAGVSSASSNSALQHEIDQLQHSAPELMAKDVKPVSNTIENLGPARDSGLTSLAAVLFQLLTADHAIDQRVAEAEKLHEQALAMRAPLFKILRATLDAGQSMQPGTAASGPIDSQPVQKTTADPAATKKRFDQLTDAFNAISNVSIPMSQEVLLLEQTRTNLLSWQATVHSERSSVTRYLLLRVIVILAALGLIFVLNEIARRAVTKYVQDIRRRRQFLVIRRTLAGFLTGIVLLFGFVTQFSSLATFAGFITAGIAVGLQTILLSVAAYFFIVGRYGVRVGDRITVAGVTGDVIDVGLVRFYMIELTGTGTELHPTGRVAVFANSILFQAGTPLYKQMPGTEYAWHELTVKLKPDTPYQEASQAVLTAVLGVYGGYKARIEQQHRLVESWMDTPVESPQVESRLQLADGLQYAVLYPVEIREAAMTDEKVVQSILQLMSSHQAVKAAMDGPPAVRAIVKG